MKLCFVPARTWHTRALNCPFTFRQLPLTDSVRGRHVPRSCPEEVAGPFTRRDRPWVQWRRALGLVASDNQMRHDDGEDRDYERQEGDAVADAPLSPAVS
jgi:hypothetical protein